MPFQKGFEVDVHVLFYLQDCVHVVFEVDVLTEILKNCAYLAIAHGLGDINRVFPSLLGGKGEGRNGSENLKNRGVDRVLGANGV